MGKKEMGRGQQEDMSHSRPPLLSVSLATTPHTHSVKSELTAPTAHSAWWPLVGSVRGDQRGLSTDTVTPATVTKSERSTVIELSELTILTSRIQQLPDSWIPSPL